MTMTEQERETRRLANKALAEQLAYLLQKGDIITHTRCMKHVEEHYFAGWDGLWICGDATENTATIEGLDKDDRWTNDIAPLSVTHINRVPVDQWLDAEMRGLLDCNGWITKTREALAKAKSKATAS